MTYLAYEPGRVAALHRAMQSACTEMMFVRSSDIEATDAMRVLRSAGRRLSDIWIPLTERILSADVLAALLPVRMDSGNLLTCIEQFMHEQHGWTVIVDELGVDDTPIVTVAETVALARILEHGDLDELTGSTGEAAWLADQLTSISDDPVLAAAFAANFHRITELCDELARRRVQLVFDDRVAEPGGPVAAIDAAYRALAAVMLAGRSDTAAPPELDRMTPYAAALLVRYLGLAPDVLATAVDDLLSRWSLDAVTDPPDDLVRPGPNTADILFRTLLETPGAPTRYVVLATHDPDTMWWSAEDPSLAQEVALVGTAPRNISVAEAGVVIPTFIDYFRLAERSAQDPTYRSTPAKSRAVLGALTAPWLRQFSPLNAEWTTGEEQSQAMTRRLAFVLEDDSAVDALVAAQRAVVDGLRVSAARDPIAVEEIAGLVGVLGALMVRERDRDEGRRKATWDMVWSVVALPVGMLPNVLSVPLTGFLGEVKRLSREHGWLGAPDTGRVHDAAVYELRWLRTVGAAAMVNTGFATLMGTGRLPAGTLPPPDPDPTAEHPELVYERAYVDWKQRNFGGVARAEVGALDALKNPFVNAADAAESSLD
jgi:hypothetical protein